VDDDNDMDEEFGEEESLLDLGAMKNNRVSGCTTFPVTVLNHTSDQIDVFRLNPNGTQRLCWLLKRPTLTLVVHVLMRDYHPLLHFTETISVTRITTTQIE